jgi:dTDP-4-dehydrorhamnose reductase
LPTELITKTDSTRFTQPARRPLRTGFIITKAMNELGYRPHTFAEGIALVQQQLEQNHQ